jgi:hypothetical protein
LFFDCCQSAFAKKHLGWVIKCKLFQWFAPLFL